MPKTDSPSPKVRQRQKGQVLRVTFPDGTVICLKRANMTMLETFRRFSDEQLASIPLEKRHLPIVSHERYAIFGDYIKPIRDGWFLNTQGDTVEKFHQLKAIENLPGFDFVTEIGDFVPSEDKMPIGDRKKTVGFCVTFPDGTLVCGRNPIETYLESISIFGAERLLQRNYSMFDKDIVTRYQKYRTQQELSKGLWVTIPVTTKDKKRVIEGLNRKFDAGLVVEDVSED